MSETTYGIGLAAIALVGVAFLAETLEGRGRKKRTQLAARKQTINAHRAQAQKDIAFAKQEEKLARQVRKKDKQQYKTRMQTAREHRAQAKIDLAFAKQEEKLARQVRKS